MTLTDEKQLLSALGRGNQSAFDSLYLFYSPRIKQFAQRLLKDPDQAEDVTQNIFLRIWERRAEATAARQFRSYLYTMTRNAVFDIYAHSLVQDKFLRESASTSRHLYDTALSEQIETEDLALLIAAAVGNMPEQRRKVFRLSREEGLSNKEIAEKLNLSPKTVERHMTEALNQLRRLLSSAAFFF